MPRKFLMVVVFILFSVIFLTSVSAEISVGVKKGDWIEYEITYTAHVGGGVPQNEHPIRKTSEVLDIVNKTIDVRIITDMSDGTQDVGSDRFSLGLVRFGGPIIPAGLNVNDSFHDWSYGDVLITRVEEVIIAGAKREVVYTNTFFETGWDKETGFLLLEIGALSGYDRITKAAKTNIWQADISYEIPDAQTDISPSPSPLDTDANESPIDNYLVVLALVVIVVIVAAVFLRKKK